LEHRALLYDGLREALDNVARHADASRVVVNLACGADASLHLSVRDNGIGVREAVMEPWTLGLHGLQERVRSTGGQLRIQQGRSRGMTLHLVLPSAESPAAESANDPELLPEHSYERLLAFLYRIPVGLIQARCDGTIELLNPMAAQMLMPLVARRGTGNLFRLLQPALPRLRAWSRRNGAAPAIICERVPVALPVTAGEPPRWLELTLHGLGDGRLVGVLCRAAAVAAPREFLAA
jgi:hypothetical protein